MPWVLFQAATENLRPSATKTAVGYAFQFSLPGSDSKVGGLGAGLKLRSVVTLCLSEDRLPRAVLSRGGPEGQKGKWLVLCILTLFVLYIRIHLKTSKHTGEIIFPVLPNFNL